VPLACFRRLRGTDRVGGRPTSWLRCLRDPSLPAVIAHRGASGYRPEHTLAGYRLAIAMGADYIEPDLVATRDGVLVARHENEIAATTDVAHRPAFAGRRTTKQIDGVAVTGWFAEDFTLAELKSLRATERLPALRGSARDGRYRIVTLGEILELARWESRRWRRPIGVYPELKHPRYFRDIGQPLERAFVRTLENHAFGGSPRVPLVVQCFEAETLRRLRSRLAVPFVLLLDVEAAESLADIAAYADAVGPAKPLLIPRRADGQLDRPTAFVDRAHDAGLAVHAYTFRNENAYLPADFGVGTDPSAHGNAVAEQLAFLRMGIDGLFTDFPDTGIEARAALAGSASREAI